MEGATGIPIRCDKKPSDCLWASREYTHFVGILDGKAPVSSMQYSRDFEKWMPSTMVSIIFSSIFKGTASTQVKVTLNADNAIPCDHAFAEFTHRITVMARIVSTPRFEEVQ